MSEQLHAPPCMWPAARCTCSLKLESTAADFAAFVPASDRPPWPEQGAYRAPRMFAMVDGLGVVDRVVAVLHGSSAIVARRPDLRSIELPEAPAHPVGKGWTYRGGVFFSPAKENGFGAGERQVKAKGSDQ